MELSRIKSKDSMRPRVKELVNDGYSPGIPFIIVGTIKPIQRKNPQKLERTLNHSSRIAFTLALTSNRPFLGHPMPRSR